MLVLIVHSNKNLYRVITPFYLRILNTFFNNLLYRRIYSTELFRIITFLTLILFTGPSTQNNELNLPQQKNESSSQEDLKCHDRIYLMQQKSEQYRNEISRLNELLTIFE